MSNEGKKTLMNLIKIAKEIKKLKKEKKIESDFLVWKDQIKKNLIDLYGKDSIEFNEFQKIDFENSDNKLNRAYDFLENLLTNISIRKVDEEILKELEELVEGEDEEIEIFLISDQKSEEKQKIVNRLKENNIQPIDINWSSSENEALKESLEENPDIEFAISVWTKDDLEEASKESGGSKKIFETGFISGILGRNKVAILHEEKAEIPEQHEQIQYIPLNENWFEELVTKMNESGYDLDLN